MSEVLLLLKLRRRSGVLAAVIAAVHNAGLTFQTQQARDVEGNPGLLLKAESDLVPEYDELVIHLESVKGVDRVVEIQFDGEPLLPQSAGPESVFDEGRIGDKVAAEVSVDDLAPLIDEISEPQPETPDNLAEQETDQPSAVVADSHPVVPSDKQISKQPDSNQDAAPKREMTRAVKRRWRRYR